MNNNFKKYLSVFKNHIFLVILMIVLIIISSVSKGKTAVTFSILAGIVMIYEGIYFFIWIIKTPAKRNKDEAM